MRWVADLPPVAARAVLAGLALVLAGCLSEPPPPREPGPELPETPAGETDPEPLRVDSVDRHAREVTLRVRNLGCGGLATGSAVAIGERLLATNRHVIEGAEALEVTTWDGRTARVEIARAATTHDIAVAEIAEDVADVADIAGGDPAPGQEVVVAGYPGGGPLRIAEGQVLSWTTDRLFGAEAGALALDVEVAPGSSGGPVLDTEGRVIGVVYALVVEDGRGLAVPVSALHEALEATDALVPAPQCPDRR